MSEVRHNHKGQPMTDKIPHDNVIDDLLACFAEYGDHDRGAMAYVLDQNFADLARKAASADRLAKHLETALETMALEGICGTECWSCAEARQALNEWSQS